MSLVANKVEHGETVVVGDDCFARRSGMTALAGS
jgi:hypothetical protein